MRFTGENENINRYVTGTYSRTLKFKDMNFGEFDPNIKKKATNEIRRPVA